MRIKGSRVLITGGLGFIGSNLAHRCVELGAETTILDAKIPKLGSNESNLEGIEGKAKLIIGDIRSSETISEAIKDKDFLFNCAAQTSHRLSMENPFLDLDINCRGALNILEAVRKAGSKIKIVYTGTTTQAGPRLFDVMDETHPEFPIDVYSANKGAAEKYHLLYHRMYGIPITSIRLPNTYGPRAGVGNPHLGFMNYFIGLALAGKELTVYRPGDQIRNILYVSDAVNALVRAMESEKSHGEVFIAASDEYHTIKSIAETIVEVMGSGSVREIDWPAGTSRIGDVRIDSSKIRKLLGWEPKTGLREGLIQTRDYFKKHPAW